MSFRKLALKEERKAIIEMLRGIPNIPDDYLDMLADQIVKQIDEVEEFEGVRPQISEMGTMDEDGNETPLWTYEQGLE